MLAETVAAAEMPSFEEAFREEFERGHASLARYLGRLTDDAAIGADLAQEAFVRLFRRGSMPDDPRAWLAAVAHNLLRTERLQVRRRARLLGARGQELAPAAMAAPDEVMESAERRARVRRALDTLAERERRMLLLRYEGFSYREIATALDLHEASVGTLLARAKEQFRDALGKE